MNCPVPSLQMKNQKKYFIYGMLMDISALKPLPDNIPHYKFLVFFWTAQLYSGISSMVFQFFERSVDRLT